VKASERAPQAMAAQMLVAAAISVPILLVTGLPAVGAWKWIAASTLINLLAVRALLRAYELAGFGLVYPIGRAVSVLLVAPLSVWLAGERLGPALLGGIGLIVVSLGLVGMSARHDRNLQPRALAWTLASGVAIACYVLADAQGVRQSGSTLAYASAVSIGNALIVYLSQHRAIAPWRLVREHWRVAVPCGLASSVSYFLILWVWRQAPIAPASALRDTSAIFALLIAVLWMKESLGGWRLAALLIAAAAIPLLRLGA
jgi:drug/metabolite transporter (DMT)-like permease